MSQRDRVPEVRPGPAAHTALEAELARTLAAIDDGKPHVGMTKHYFAARCLLASYDIRRKGNRAAAQT
jgi:hypothetical protein